MSPTHTLPHVAIVGAGIFGVSSALHLARLGGRVTLVSAGEPGDGASSRSLSWLNSARFRSAEYHALRMAGIDRYRTLAARSEAAGWLRFDGGLTWDAPDSAEETARVYAHERAIGYDAQLLPPDRVATVTPGVDSRAISAQGAIFNPGEGWVDLPSLIGSLLQEFAARGGQIVAGAGAASVATSGARATGVTLANGDRIAADAVLVAAGAETPRIVALLGQDIPDATPISLLLRTTPMRHPLRAVLNTPRVAVRPTPTGAFVCDADWSEKEVGRRENGGYDVRQDTIQRLLAEVSAVLEGNPRLQLEVYGVGPKPIPQDGEPVLGQLEKVPGCYVAFSHSGATLGLIAGEVLADEIVTGARHPLTAKFRPGRFAA